MKLRSLMDQKVYLDEGFVVEFKKDEVFELTYGELDHDNYFGWWYNDRMILPKRAFAEATEKDEFLWRVKSHLEFIGDNELLSQERKLEQAFGFIQGCSFCHEEYIDDLTDVFESFRSKILWGR